MGATVWWCNEVVDELERQCERRGFGRDGVGRAKYHEVPAVSHRTHRRHFGISAQSSELCAGSGEGTAHASRSRSLCRTGIRCQRLLGDLSSISDLQVVAATATLCMCVKLHDNPLERASVWMVNCRPLLTKPRYSLSAQRRTKSRFSKRMFFVQSDVSLSSEQKSSHVQLVRLFLGSLLLLLGNLHKSYCFTCNSQKTLLPAPWRSAHGCVHNR